MRGAAMRLLQLVVLVTHGALDSSLWYPRNGSHVPAQRLQQSPLCRQGGVHHRHHAAAPRHHRHCAAAPRHH